MGLIHWWARAGSAMPGIANAAMQAPRLGAAVKWVAGIASERSPPQFSRETFTRWFQCRGQKSAAAKRVILWPDSFNNFFDPHILKAAVNVLEAAGYQVTIPSRPLCCGRPLYDWGMLDTAKHQLRQIIEVLRRDIENGTPLIGLEPACVSAFRDELPSLLPDEPLARRLSEQTHFFSDFLYRDEDDLRFRPLSRQAVVQLHCHHHAVIGGDAEWLLLERLGIRVIAKPSGCCGMAGSLGFESAKQDVSRKAGERALFPSIEDHDDSTIILADGFSCREQIRHGTGRHARHIAEIAAAALR